MNSNVIKPMPEVKPYRKQTAVEWLVDELSKDQYPDHIPYIIERAKQMEKDLIKYMVETIEANRWRVLHRAEGKIQWIGGENKNIKTTPELIEKYLK
jgi:hypothetical protein